MAGVNSANGIVVWILGGTGVLLVYSAIKNKTPQSIVTRYVTPAINTPTVVLDEPSQMQNRTNQPSPNLDRVRRNSEGVAYIYNSDGYEINAIPAGYQTSPGTYLPVSAITA